MTTLGKLAKEKYRTVFLCGPEDGAVDGEGDQKTKKTCGHWAAYPNWQSISGAGSPGGMFIVGVRARAPPSEPSPGLPLKEGLLGTADRLPTYLHTTHFWCTCLLKNYLDLLETAPGSTGPGGAWPSQCLVLAD